MRRRPRAGPGPVVRCDVEGLPLPLAGRAAKITGVDPLGIIAGNGEFPFCLARAARRQGIPRLVAAAFEGETDPAIASCVDEVVWLKIGQLDRLIKVFTSRGVRQVVMAGGITPANLFKNLRLDWRMLGVAARLPERNAASIFGAVAGEMHKDGVELVDPRPFLGDAVPSAGALTRQEPSAAQREEIAFGLKIAKAVSVLDIGQTVVVKLGTVLAVEGFEGTDECIRRGGALAGDKGGAVVVKVSKPNQDFRFDIPCIGMTTIQSCAAGQIAVLAIEAGSSLLLGRDELLTAADRQELRVVGVEAQ